MPGGIHAARRSHPTWMPAGVGCRPGAVFPAPGAVYPQPQRRTAWMPGPACHAARGIPHQCRAACRAARGTPAGRASVRNADRGRH